MIGDENTMSDASSRSAGSSWMPNRRQILGGAAAAFALSCTPRREQTSAEREVLVVLFLRGGVDGLSLCVPHADDALYTLRPTLAVPAPGKSGGAIDLDGHFGLHPCAAPLLDSFREGRLALVHACGSTDPTRSHFDAMRIVETGAAASVRDGWLTRALAAMPRRTGSPLRAISVDRFLPKSLSGSNESLAVLDPLAYQGFLSRPVGRPVRRDLEHLWSSSSVPAGRSAFNSLAMFDRVRLDVRQPPRGTPYPDTDLGKNLATAAAWIRADAGIEVLTLDYGGWDMHGALGPLDGEFARKTTEVASALSAFDRDLGPWREHVTLVAMTEFGRRANENASAGTDHGHGACWIVMGGGIRGGRVVTRWPGLRAQDLDAGDLAITTDARDVLGEILVQRAACRDLANVFPQHVAAFPGLTT
jgi:uncharacterized protein (DUF1501 family)